MSAKLELAGKTISGVIGVQDSENGPARIWMLQFTDGTHVEFVSPKGRRRIRPTAVHKTGRVNAHESEPQLALNVA